MKELTDRQQEIFDFVTDTIQRTSIPPTSQEICDRFGFASTRAAQKHLQAIEAKGFLTLRNGTSRGISLRGRNSAPARSKTLSLPILGRVAAGNPVEADIGSDDVVLIDRTMFSRTPDYLLKVQGDSMKDDGIWDGDLVAVHRTSHANNNETVVARINGEITIKRLKQTHDKIWLLPRNPDFAPIEVPADADFAIEGIYCGLVRR
ncbi:MAG: transcriptional repressor LexA [Arenimonas sp.]